MPYPITEDAIVQLFPDAYAFDDDELDTIFSTYVKIGEEIVGVYRNGEGGIYTRI